MLRLRRRRPTYFKLRRLKRRIRKIILRFRKIRRYFLTEYSDNSFYTSCFHVTIPKRQQHFRLQKLATQQTRVFSGGQILQIHSKRSKFFKRHYQNIASIIMQLKIGYPEFLKKIYLFSLKNFNRRQFIFFEKFTDALRPTVKYFMHKQSFAPRFLPKRRIKKNVFRMINKE